MGSLKGTSSLTQREQKFFCKLHGFGVEYLNQSLPYSKKTFKLPTSEN